MKKHLCTALAFLMLISSCITTQAQAKSALKTQLQSELDTRKAEVYSSVFEQLKRQDALEHLDIYLDILYPEVEAAIYSKYGITQAETSRANITLYWPNGGVLMYTDPDVNCKVTSTYLTPDDAEYLLEPDTTALGIFFGLVGTVVPPAAQPYMAVLTLVIGGISYAQQDIQQADGYARTISVYDPINVQSSAVAAGWDTHCNVIYSSRLQNVVPCEAET